LRSSITWGDLLFGILATALTAFVLIGFSFQIIPNRIRPAAQIEGTIYRLVDGIVSDNQPNAWDIRLKYVRLVKESFYIILTGIFHHRIDCPGYDFKHIREDSENTEVQDPDHKSTEAV
jgi:hypothetical protein